MAGRGGRPWDHAVGHRVAGHARLVRRARPRVARRAHPGELVAPGGERARPGALPGARREARARQRLLRPLLMDQPKQLVVVGDRVLIVPEGGEERTRVGLYVPQTAVDSMAVQGGRIVATGPGNPVAEPTAL